MRGALLAAVALASCAPTEDPGPVRTAASPPPEKASKPAAGRPDHPLRNLTRSSVRVGSRKIPVWVADTDPEREVGLMWVKPGDLPDGEGMLFVFPDARPRSFWMRNTLIPLDIVYLDPEGRVLNVQKGEPRSEKSLPSKGPAQYVIEVKAGKAAAFGLRPGAKVIISPEGR